MAEKVVPAASTFQSAEGGMSFEPAVQVRPRQQQQQQQNSTVIKSTLRQERQQKVPKTTEKKESRPSKVLRSDDSGTMFMARQAPRRTPLSPKTGIPPSTTSSTTMEKKESQPPSSKIFQSKNAGISYEVSPPATTLTEKRRAVIEVKTKSPPVKPSPQRIVKTSDSKLFRSSKNGIDTLPGGRVSPTRRKTFQSDDGGMMFTTESSQQQPVKKRLVPFRRAVKSTGAAISKVAGFGGSMFRAVRSQVSAAPGPSAADAQQQIAAAAAAAEEARLAEKVRVEEKMRLAEESRLREETRGVEEARVALAIAIEEEEREEERKRVEAARLASVEEEKEREEERKRVEAAAIANAARLAVAKKEEDREEDRKQAEIVAARIATAKEEKEREEERKRVEAEAIVVPASTKSLETKDSTYSTVTRLETDSGATGGKFWQIQANGLTTTVSFGSLFETRYTQSREKIHKSAALASKYCASQIKSKIKKGYQYAEAVTAAAAVVSPIPVAGNVTIEVSTAGSTRIVKIEEENEVPSVNIFQTETAGVVEMEEKKQPPSSIFQSENAGISFEAAPKRTAPTQRIVKMKENKPPPSSIFQSENAGISYEVSPPKRTAPVQRIVKMTEKKERRTSNLFEVSDGMSVDEERRPSSATTSETGNVDFTIDDRTRIESEIEKEISEETKLLSIIETEKKRSKVARTVEERKRAEEAQSTGNARVQGEPTTKETATFASDGGMNLVSKTGSSSNDPSTRDAASSSPGYGLFQRAKRPVTFESDGSQSDLQQEQLLRARKLANYKKMAELFGTRENSPPTFVTDDTGMNMVVTKRVTKKQPIAIPPPRLNPSDDGSTASNDVPPVLFPKSDDNNNEGMKMIATELRKQSFSALGGLKDIQQSSKMNVNTAKKTASDIYKFAKFVSDGLQMVQEDAQEKKAIMTPAEARRKKKLRELEGNKMFGFDIERDEKDKKIQDAGTKSSEEILASQLMEGGKNVAKFAFDGLQMVYRAAEKQTNDYILASQEEKATMMNNNESVTTPTTADDDDTKTVSTQPFFAAVATKDAAIQKTAHDNHVDGKTKPTSVINDSSPTPFFGAVIGSNDRDESSTKKELTHMDSSSTDDKSNASTLLAVAAGTETDDNNRKKKKEEMTMKLDLKSITNEKKITSTTTVADAIHHTGTTPTIPTNNVVEQSFSSSSSSPSPNSSSTSSSSSLLRSGGRMLWKFVGDGLQMVAQQVVSSSSSSSTSKKGK